MSYFGNLQKIKVGLANEYIAAAWLTKENYTVYWKTQDNDVIDLVAVHRITGKVLKIGGLKEKLIAAKRSGITNVIVPHENLGDVEEIESNILKDLQIIPVKNITEVLKVALI